MIFTKDERDKNAPIKPFPAHLDYLRVLTRVLQHENDVFIDKARQMFVSTLVLLYAYWLCLFQPGRRVLLSKSTEDEAIDLLDQKVRFVHGQTPAWFQRWAGVKPRPKSKVPFARQSSQILAAGQNVADAEARGGTSSLTIIDEAAFQEHFSAIRTAALPQSQQIVQLTSPNIGDPGADVFMSYLEPDAESDTAAEYEQVPGINVRRTSRKVVVVEIDPWADPSKNEEWLAEVRRKYPSHVAFRREMLRDWTSSAGEPYYPEFDARSHVCEVGASLPMLPVDRGWDFGWRAPAVVWTIYHREQDRMVVIRELCPNNVDTASLAALVRYLSGEWPLAKLYPHPRALEVLGELKRNGRIPEPPWFAPGTEFRDYAGPEATKISATVTGDKAERTDAQVLASMGIHLSMMSVTLEASENVIRRLLKPRDADKVPGLLFDKACHTLIRGFGGGLAWTAIGGGQVYKDGKYENPHDALRYVASQVVPLVHETRASEADLISAVVSKETAAWAAIQRYMRHGRAS